MKPDSAKATITYINNPTQFSPSDPRSAMPLMGVMQTVMIDNEEDARAIFKEVSEYAKDRPSIVAALNEFIGRKYTVKVKLEVNAGDQGYIEKAMGQHVASGYDRAQGW